MSAESVALKPLAMCSMRVECGDQMSGPRDALNVRGPGRNPQGGPDVKHDTRSVKRSAP